MAVLFVVVTAYNGIGCYFLLHCGFYCFIALLSISLVDDLWSMCFYCFIKKCLFELYRNYKKKFVIAKSHVECHPCKLVALLILNVLLHFFAFLAACWTCLAIGYLFDFLVLNFNLALFFIHASLSEPTGMEWSFFFFSRLTCTKNCLKSSVFVSSCCVVTFSITLFCSFTLIIRNRVLTISFVFLQCFIFSASLAGFCNVYLFINCRYPVSNISLHITFRHQMK